LREREIAANNPTMRKRHVTMPRLLFAAAIASFLALSCLAGELTIAPSTFTITTKIPATVFPEAKTTFIPSAPLKWNDWTIRSIAPHGSRVSRGEPLVEFDAQSILRKIDATKRSITDKSLALAQAEQDLAHLQTTSQHKIENLKTSARIAREDFDYFTKTRRDAEERSADQSLDRAKQFLANQTEELRQLKKMYEADDLTDETEEIILIRQQNAVNSATFALEMESMRHKRTREVLLPREAVTLENSHRDAQLALDQGLQSIPRSIERKSSEVEALKTDLEQEKQNLSELQTELPLMIINAAENGTFFHGIIENGRWTTVEIVKSLYPGGRPSMARPFATFVPTSAPLGLFALTDDSTARSLTPDLKSTAVLTGREDLASTATLASISPTPATDGKHTLIFRTNWPKDFLPGIGTTAEIRLTSYHKPNAITVPIGALHFTEKGFVVPVKLTNGKTENRPVRRGRVSGNTVEILEGLETGQVVIVPLP